MIMIIKFDSWIIWPVKTKHIMYVFNAMHSAFFNVTLLFVFEIFFFNIYFLTIVFYFTNKLFISIYKSNRKRIIALRVGYGIFIGIYCISILTSTLIEDNRC
jgi:hypothetical protein